MILLTHDKFANYCARFEPSFEVEARKCATITIDHVEIKKECIDLLNAKFKPIPRVKSTISARRFGLGDAVAAVADPIARLSDAMLGTKLVECGGCAKRKAALNALVPDISNLTERKDRD